MTEFTPWLSLAGGALIGLSAVMLMAFHGRVAGISGIVADAVAPSSRDCGWRLAFLAGAIIAPLILTRMMGVHVPFDSNVPPAWLIIGGLIVGIGVSLGSGCTSGHGVCGMARLSRRSIVATLLFMGSTAATVFVIRHVMGGL